MTFLDTIKQFLLAEKADILIELQEDRARNAYLSFENNERWLQLELSRREEKLRKVRHILHSENN